MSPFLIPILLYFGVMIGIAIASVTKTKNGWRWIYGVLLIVIFFIGLWIPVMNGGDKFGWIQVWWAYMLLQVFAFDPPGNPGEIIWMSLGVSALHMALSLGVAKLGQMLLMARTKSSTQRSSAAARAPLRES